MSPVLHVVSRRTNRDFGRDDGTTRHLAPCQPINRVFGVRLSVSMVVSLGRLVDRGVLEAARACGEAASSVPRGPPCHAVLSSNGLWHCIPEYPQRLTLPIDTSYKCVASTPDSSQHLTGRSSSCAPRLIPTPTPSSPAHHAPRSSHSSPASAKHARPGAPHRRAVVTSSHHASSSHSPVAHSPAVAVPSGYHDGSNWLRVAVCFPTRTTESEAHFVVLVILEMSGDLEDVFCQL